jgi:hypothetical protein
MIAFVKDIGDYFARDKYLAALDALIDPVRKHLPESVVTFEPIPGAINVRYFTHIPGNPKPGDVFVSHGIADKRWRTYTAVKGFDHIFHSGPAWQAKYLEQGCPEEKLYQVGYAKLDPAFNDLKRGDGPRVLWAPTHRRAWPYQYEALEALMRTMDVGISQHPQEAGPKQSTLQALVDADVVIADGGSTLYEAWALGKPVVFPKWTVKRSQLVLPKTFEHAIYRQKIGYHAETQAELQRQIDRALTHGITQAERDFIEGIFPTHLRGTSGKAHADALLRIEHEHGDPR